MIIVTGGCGFIGSWLCEALAKSGRDVIAADNWLTGSRWNVEHLTMKNFKMLHHDITKPLEMEGVGEIYHLASPASPVDYQRLPIETLLANSLGTLNALELARRNDAKFLLASTSEIYGNPLEHPQRESYWGNVNPIGPRACYDESKRFAEALTMAYHKKYGIKTKIARIFNSILEDEIVVVFNHNEMHITEIGKYSDKFVKERPREVLVPSFNLRTLKVELKPISALIKHPYSGDAYEILTSYGRKVKVTGDHSVFIKGEDGKPAPKPVRKIKVGDYVALPTYLPVIENDTKKFNIGNRLIEILPEKELFKYSIIHPKLQHFILLNKGKIYQILKRLDIYKYGSREFYNIYKNRFLKNNQLPLIFFKRLKIPTPENAKIKAYAAGYTVKLPNMIEVDKEFLWLLGFFIAEGSYNYKKGKSSFLTFSSDEYLLKKAKSILENKFGAHVIFRGPIENKAPALYVHSKILYIIFDKILRILDIKNSGLPNWIFQLPLNKLKYFLEGYREGDGTHSGKLLGNELAFNTTNKKLADQLLFILLRFGIIGSFGKYYTTFKSRYGNRKFKFYRVTVCNVSDFDVLQWDKGVKQITLHKQDGDIIWAIVKGIKKCKSSYYVYDFSVPDSENFIAGNGVFCHNTYGPRMRSNDGRVMPTFIMQALRNEPLTINGDGSQTRSFCFVSDMVAGLQTVMEKGDGEPVNLGNPDEITIRELAERIISACRSESKLIFKPMPQDDPERRKPDISRAKALGWSPSVAFNKGLAATIDYFKA